MSNAVEIWATTVAKFSGSLNKQEDEPGVVMAKTMESLRLNPTSVPA